MKQIEEVPSNLAFTILVESTLNKVQLLELSHFWLTLLYDFISYYTIY